MSSVQNHLLFLYTAWSIGIPIIMDDDDNPEIVGYYNPIFNLSTNRGFEYCSQSHGFLCLSTFIGPKWLHETLIDLLEGKSEKRFRLYVHLCSFCNPRSNSPGFLVVFTRHDYNYDRFMTNMFVGTNILRSEINL